MDYPVEDATLDIGMDLQEFGHTNHEVDFLGFVTTLGMDLGHDSSR